MVGAKLAGPSHNAAVPFPLLLTANIAVLSALPLVLYVALVTILSEACAIAAAKCRPTFLV